MALSNRLNPVAFLWGLAEATLFFIVPDVLLSGAAMARPRAALVACAWATAGALAGGTLMYLWGATAPSDAWALLDRVPGIDGRMQAGVGEAMAGDGLAALFMGPLTGTPYKLYAVAAGAQGANLAAFLLVSVPARALRFVALVLLTHMAARTLPGQPGTRLHWPIWAVAWTGFYVFYFTTLGW